MLQRVVIALTLLIGLAPSLACALDLANLNRGLSGTVVDCTFNHGKDLRLHAKTLGIKRDLYIYLPPHYDPKQEYPLLLWLHGFGGDEEQFLEQTVCALDRAIRCGDLPPLIAAAPDGSLPATPLRPWHQGSWFVNSAKGRWADYIFCDVIPFLHRHFSISADRGQHVVAGWSMGGFAAYNLGIKHGDYFKVLVGIYPNLNLRYANRQGHWNKHRFDPQDFGQLRELRYLDQLGYYPNTPVPIVAGLVYCPVWGSGSKAAFRMSQENPLELLYSYNVQPGQFDMLISYGGNDEYNINSQAESFLHFARRRGLSIWERYDPNGHHQSGYVNACLTDTLREVGNRLRRNASFPHR